MAVSHTIGLMSGTSLDGVDGVIAAFHTRGKPHQLARAHLPLSAQLRDELLSLNAPGYDEIARSAKAGILVSKIYAQVVDELLSVTGLNRESIAAIGAHGQTVRHVPDQGYTTQLLAPALLAERTGIDVIADFRSRDVAAGGQGAPLVPAFHRHVFGQDLPRVILNLGGIANVTLLRQGTHTVGFDTGPANMLLDLWCERYVGQPFDVNGQWASQGHPDAQLLAHLIDSEPWFGLPAPKSTGRDLFNAHWLDARLQLFPDIAPADVQATLVCLTVTSVIKAIEPLVDTEAPIYVCGGGALNQYLMQQLQRRWPGAVKTTDELGIAAMDVEALAFAWLAWAHLQNKTSNLPEVTGAVGPRILGACWPA
jgi:anhydro-N-acetylmuramic acid kinase